jgi:hypothetical protein
MLLCVKTNCIIGARGEEPWLRSVEKNIKDAVVADLFVELESLERHNQSILKQIAVKTREMGVNKVSENN